MGLNKKGGLGGGGWGGAGGPTDNLNINKRGSRAPNKKGEGV